MLGLTIGNFDGVHLGHQRLLDAGRSVLGNTGRLVAVTFDPQPAAVLGKAVDPPLVSLERRRSLLRQAGADEVLVLETDRSLLSLEPEAFLDHLDAVLGASPDWMIEGPDFRFGRRREGTVATLQKLGAIRGFAVRVEQELTIPLQDGHVMPARSSAIRQLLRLGRVEDASRLLGGPHVLHGKVVQGDQRGRTIGIPTANLDLEGALLPGDGVFAGVAILPDGSRRAAAVSIGTKPTFEATPRVAEVHVLDWDGELDDYGWSLDAELHRRLRGQYRYDDLSSLQAQIDRDLADVRAVIGEKLVT
ncbi:MAG: riboflavin biosynthesis protein RibF [Planctomycetota bacterium]|jgi:riboflavin kinase / FMN adenylyltransferase|nr:riboflavin biosynthesis protein RibF [Planctomycetota bacterium]MDA1026647.1 riboflavin biosynthesis protein RibF [Planctomycetota bacterium]